jgi:hypothetical protein
MRPPTDDRRVAKHPEQESETMTMRPVILLLAAATLLAACQTTGTPSCAQQGYAAGTPEHGACVEREAQRLKYVNKAYGNCGHCQGGSSGR